MSEPWKSEQGEEQWSDREAWRGEEHQSDDETWRGEATSEWDTMEDADWESTDENDWRTETFLAGWPEDLAGPEYWMFKNFGRGKKND